MPLHVESYLGREQGSRGGSQFYIHICIHSYNIADPFGEKLGVRWSYNYLLCMEIVRLQGFRRCLLWLFISSGLFKLIPQCTHKMIGYLCTHWESPVPRALLLLAPRPEILGTIVVLIQASCWGKPAAEATIQSPPPHSHGNTPNMSSADLEQKLDITSLSLPTQEHKQAGKAQNRTSTAHIHQPHLIKLERPDTSCWKR